MTIDRKNKIATFTETTLDMETGEVSKEMILQIRHTAHLRKKLWNWEE